MTDKCTYFFSEKIIVANDEKTMGFAMRPLISEKNGNLSCGDILVKSVNIGNCNEKDKLILMFDDSTKISLVSWNKFNCEGDAWFSLKLSDIDKLASHKIIKAYFQNGRSYDSYTAAILAEDQDYFMIIMNDCKNNKFTLKQ